jgi:hypothetical protein
VKIFNPKIPRYLPFILKILFSSTVMQMICAWHKIWTLSGRLSLMRNVRLMKKIYIPCVPHKNNCNKKVGSHDMKQTQNFLLSNILRFAFKIAFERIFNVMQLILVKIKWHIKWKYLIQKFHDICLSGNNRTKTFLHEVMIGNHRNKATES